MLKESINMKISVVIPAYNEEKIIRKTLGFIQKQTYQPYEIIVVDNNSTDKTAEMARSMGVTVVEEHVQGLTPARNTGFNAAKGEIIARTDADTQVPPNWLEMIEEAFKKDTKLVGLSGPILYFDLNVGQIAPLIQIYSQTCKLLYGCECMIGPNFAIRKSAWKKIKDEVCMDDNRVHEDIDLSIHISTVGKVRFDKSLIVRTSGRRIKKNPASFFFGYATKHLPMIKRHTKIPLKPTNLLRPFVSEHET